MPARLLSWLVVLAMSGRPGSASGPESPPGPFCSPPGPWKHWWRAPSRRTRRSPRGDGGCAGPRPVSTRPGHPGCCPRLRFESASGLVPDAEGDVFNPPEDTTGFRSLGVFNRTELQVRAAAVHLRLPEQSAGSGRRGGRGGGVVACRRRARRGPEGQGAVLRPSRRPGSRRPRRASGR